MSRTFVRPLEDGDRGWASDLLERDVAAVESALREALPPYRDPDGARPWPWLTTILR